MKKVTRYNREEQLAVLACYYGIIPLVIRERGKSMTSYVKKAVSFMFNISHATLDNWMKSSFDENARRKAEYIHIPEDVLKECLRCVDVSASHKTKLTMGKVKKFSPSYLITHQKLETSTSSVPSPEQMIEHNTLTQAMRPRDIFSQKELLDAVDLPCVCPRCALPLESVYEAMSTPTQEENMISTLLEQNEKLRDKVAALQK